MPELIQESNDLMLKLRAEKKSAREFQERKHADWNDIYELSRNKVKTNRLTQRQAVNIPLLRETEKTILAKIDDPPSVEWRELGGDRNKEIILQEIWNDDFQRLNFENVDIQDKKNIVRYGRGFKKINWSGEFGIDALDIFDIVIDPLVNPIDIETARFVIHQNIFRSLREILSDDRYTKEGKDKLKEFLSTREGVIQSSKNKEEYEKKMERLRAMGVQDKDFALFHGGDVIINLTEHYTNLWNPDTKKFERKVIVYAEDDSELLNERISDLIGVDFYPFVTWSEDLETNDFWNDGIGNLVLVPNKVLNVWYSQLIENRTLKNFQMHWYDATVQGYVPQTYEPRPGAMLPAPGDPNKTILPVNISGLDDTLTAIDFIIRLVERGTAATAIEKGVSEKKQITLGEVQILVGKAMERTLAMAKFYRRSWQELAMKWFRLMDANKGKKRTLYKLSRKGTIWPKIIYPSDWKSEMGYKAIVASTSEQEEEKTQGIQRMLFVESRHPQNIALKKVLLKRELEILDLTTQEMKEIEDEERKISEQPPIQSAGEEQQLAQDIEQRVGELKNLSNA